MLIGLIAGGASQCGRGAMMQNAPQVEKGPVIAKIGTTELTADQVEAGVTERLKDYSNQSSPALQFQARSVVLDDALAYLVRSKLAADKGIKLDDSDVTASLEKELNDQMQNTAMQAKLFMPKASEPEIESAVVQQMRFPATVKSFAEARALADKNIREGLKDPAKRPELLKQALTPMLLANVKEKLKPTDAELKASYDSLTYKRILITDKSAGKETPVEKANEVLKEVKGGLDFDKAIDRYSNDLPQANMKLSQAKPTTVRILDLKASPSTKAIADLKPGEVSDVVNAPEGAIIYKAIKITSDVPKDFEAKKATYSEQYTNQQAGNVLADEISKVQDGKDIEWVSKGYEVLYKLSKVLRSQGKPAELQKQYTDLAAEAKKAMDGDPAGGQAAMLARYVAEEALWGAAKTPEKQKPLIGDRREAITAVLQNFPDRNVELDLAEMNMQAGEKDQVFENLMNAAQQNTNYVDDQTGGQSVWNRINSLQAKLVASKALTADQLKQLQDKQDEWRANRKQFDDAEAQRKKQEAEDKKRADEEAKKAAAEAKKNPGKPPVKPNDNLNAPSTGLPGMTPPNGVPPTTPPKK